MPRLKLLKSDWQKSRYGLSKYPLLLAGDRIVGNADGNVFALDIYTGKEIVTQLEPGQKIGLPYSGKSSEAVQGNGALYFLGNDVLRALRLADGVPVPGWKSPQIKGMTRISAVMHPTDLLKGVVVTASVNVRGVGQVTGYNMSDGSVAWGPLTLGQKSPGKIGLGQQWIYFVAATKLTAIHTGFGDTRWSVHLRLGAAESSPVDTLNEDMVPLVTSDKVICVGSRLHAVKISDGTQLWSAVLSDRQTEWVQPFVDEAAGIVVAASRGVAADGAPSGELRCIELATGQTKWIAPINGIPGIPSVAGDTVYVHSDRENRLHSFKLDDPKKHAVYGVDRSISKIPAVIGNGTLFIPMDDGEIHAMAFADQSAAYFDGTARIDITPDGSQFKFSENCLTMEAWVHSTEGGDIVSGFPLVAEAGKQCFRFNLSKDGELGFGILSPDQRDLDLFQSTPTRANDGFWHHVAVTWENGIAILYLDGIALPTTSIVSRNGTRLFTNGLPVTPDNTVRRDWLKNPRPAPLTLHGENTLTLGAFRPSAGGEIKHNFSGQLREIRIWDKAVNVNVIQSRMNRIVGPLGDSAQANAALLLGNWHLDDKIKGDRAKIVNDVSRHAFTSSPQGVVSRVTDLALDDSAFPFLVDQVVSSWPDVDHWSARGQHSISTAAALSEDGILCFGTGMVLYGVEDDSGTRRWSMSTQWGASKPVAHNHSFYLLNGKSEVIEIEAETGQRKVLYSFKFPRGKRPKLILGASPDTISAPACDERFIAAAAPDGKVWVFDRTVAPTAAARTFTTAPSPGDLALSGGVLSFITGEHNNATLFTIDLTDPNSQPLQLRAHSDVIAAHGRSLFYIDDAGHLASRDHRGTVRLSPSITTDIAAGIIGMAASMDDDLLVAVTKDGVLHGLSFATLARRWTSNFPALPPRKLTAAHEPARSPHIKNGVVYVAHRTLVAAFDGGSGSSVGLFVAPHDVTTSLAVHDDGTVYFGCATEAAGENLDGALHSVVLGRNAALRLGLDIYGTPTTRADYLRVREAAPKTALSLMNVRDCCIEAWVNTKRPGEILSVCPSSSMRYGLRLSIADGGQVRYRSSRAASGSAWTTLTAAALPAPVLINGEWHHIAVSSQRKPNSEECDVRIYIDGVAQTIASNVTAASTPAAVVQGLHAYIGADATRAGNAPADHFIGLISEVRVWDTYMTASDISERMHTKLRGIEPALAAYWNFALGIHDESPSGHDFEFAVPSADPSFWLSDLSFDLPNYPYLTTAAVLTQMGEETDGSSAEQDDDLLLTKYDLTITALAADGTPLADHTLDLWYVKHPDEEGLPETITLQPAGEPQPTEIHGVRPDHELLNRRSPLFREEHLLKAKNSFTRKTNNKGQIVITVVTKLAGHGPALDLHAGFMPTNERFHINVLNDDQKLEIPAPPSLTAQSKLIQDYHYSPGTIVDDTRSREVYRTVLTAQNSDGGPRVRERFEIWAAETCEIEVAGVKYTVNAQNSQSFRADELGALTIDVGATELKMPDLSVWAGFMHRGERITVSVDQDAQTKLADVSGNAMSDKNRMVNWKKGEPERGALLKDDYHPHAEKISESVRHLSSAAQPATNPTPLRASAGLLGSEVVLRAQAKSVQMRQSAPVVRGDEVRLVRTQRHIMRTATVTPEAVLNSLAASHDGSIGFEIDFSNLRANSNANSNAVPLGVHYLTEDTAERYLAGARAAAAPPVLLGAHSLTDTHLKVGWQGGEVAPNLSHNLGYFWDDAFDWVADAAEKAINEIKKIALIVADTVMVAVEYATEIVYEAINTVADALRYVGEFFYKLAMLIIDVIKFLMFVFDWSAIIETHDILKGIFQHSTRLVSKQIRSLGAQIPAGLSSLVESLMSMIGVRSANAPAALPSGVLTRALGAVPLTSAAESGEKEMSGIPGTMVISRAKNFVPENIIPSVSEPLNAGMQMAVKFLQMLMDVVADLFSGDVEAAGNRLLNALTEAVDQIMGAVVTIVDRTIQILVDSLATVIDKLVDYRIEIPFISDLYKWIVGSDLTFLDLMALILAIPVNLVYGIITGVTSGELRHFNEDGRSLLGDLQAISTVRSGGGKSAGNELGALPWKIPSSQQRDNEFAVTRIIYSVGTYLADMLFVPELSGVRTPLRPLAKIMKGLSGIASSLLMFLFLTPEYLDKLEHEVSGFSNDLAMITVPTAFALSVLGDGITLCTGAAATWNGMPALSPPVLSPNGPTKWEGDIRGGNPSGIDSAEFLILTLRNYGLVAQAAFSIYSVTNSKEFADNRTMPIAYLYLGRDLLSTIPRFISPLYTQEGQQTCSINPGTYVKLAKLRAFSNLGATAAHLVGAQLQWKL